MLSCATTNPAKLKVLKLSRSLCLTGWLSEATDICYGFLLLLLSLSLSLSSLPGPSLLASTSENGYSPAAHHPATPRRYLRQRLSSSYRWNVVLHISG